MATRIERMQESLENYKKKIIETEAKIKAEKEALVGKREEAEKKLAEAKAKFDALYGDLPTLPTEDGVSTDGGLFEEVEGE